MPTKQGIEALRDIYRKNPDYFDQFAREADRRAIEVLGPLFGIDQKVWTKFREEYLGSDAERALSKLHSKLRQLLEETQHFIHGPRSAAMKSSGRLSRKGVLKPRLTHAEKKARIEAKQLRLVAHRLVLSLAKKKDISPAVVYGELTKKYGHPAKEANVDELHSRISYLKTTLSRL